MLGRPRLYSVLPYHRYQKHRKTYKKQNKRGSDDPIIFGGFFLSSCRRILVPSCPPCVPGAIIARYIRSLTKAILPWDFSICISGTGNYGVHVPSPLSTGSFFLFLLSLAVGSPPAIAPVGRLLAWMICMFERRRGRRGACGGPFYFRRQLGCWYSSVLPAHQRQFSTVIIRRATAGLGGLTIYVQKRKMPPSQHVARAAAKLTTKKRNWESSSS